MEKIRKGEPSKMIKIEANTLEELYEKASKELMCSVADLDIDIIQQPSNFLGLFKKLAIAIVGIKKGATISKAYMQDDYVYAPFKKVKSKLETAFKGLKGSEDSMEYKDLAGFHFTMGMPYYEDMESIASGDNAKLIEKAKAKRWNQWKVARS